jgi:hypothetical protein
VVAAILVIVTSGTAASGLPFVIAAAGLHGKGLSDMRSQRPAVEPPVSKERELLSTSRANGGSITPAEAAMETSLTVREADGMLSELAGGGHLAVESRTEPCSTRCLADAALNSKEGRRAAAGRGGFRRYRPVNLASRFSKNAVTPSLWSCVKPQNV